MASSEALDPPAALFSSSSGSLPDDLVWAGTESFPNLIRIPVPPCHLLCPGASSGCTRLFLHHSLWPSPHPHRLGSRTSRTPVQNVSRVTGLYHDSSLSLRPGGLLALHRQGLLRSSFHLMSHLYKVSNITTRANSQFPWLDLHQQGMRPYGLRTDFSRITQRTNLWALRSKKSAKGDPAALQLTDVSL